MSDQEWEYCQLFLTNRIETKSGYAYQLVIDYLGVNSYNLATSDDKSPRIFAYNPFKVAVGLLGRGGGELVHIQHSITNYEESMFLGSIARGDGFSVIKHNNVVAYFKRPIKPGRQPQDPTIILP